MVYPNRISTLCRFSVTRIPAALASTPTEQQQRHGGCDRYRDAPSIEISASNFDRPLDHNARRS